MWLFISLLCLSGLAFSVVRASLPERRGISLTLSTLPALACALSTPWASRVNVQVLSQTLDSFTVLQDLCVIVIVESVLLALLLLRLMRHDGGRAHAFLRALATLPALGAVFGAFLLLVFVFNTTTGWSFLHLGCLLALALGLLMGGGTLLVRQLFRDVDSRLEVLLFLAFVQGVLAMFLPLLARGGVVPSRADDHPFWAIPLAAALALACLAMAFVVRRATLLIGR
ncbi:MAG: hypothetical protein AAF533_08285 [Acidobacteriota bacterium]